MDASLDRLLDAFQRAEHSVPADIVSAVRELPEPGCLTSPWESWTLIGLVRHQIRQNWLAEIIQTRMGANLSLFAARGSFGHPEGVPQSGTVPGLPEWEYYFHGKGCCLTHKVDGDSIDVDFWEDSANYFDTFFYTNYLTSLRHPELPEQRLLTLSPAGHGIRITVADLLVKGALTPLSERKQLPYRLSDRVFNNADAIDGFCYAWSDPRRRVWLAALIGDWIGASEAASGQPELKTFTSKRAEQCREIRYNRLRHELSVQNWATEALYALADMGADNLNQILEEMLKKPPSSAVIAALEIIARQNDPAWCPRVFSLFRRLDPNGQLPQPRLWILCIRFMLIQGFKMSKICAALTRAGGTEIGEASLLALEYAPELVLNFFRRGLHSDLPIDRTQVAAILALIGQPWSQRELLRALEASDDQQKTVDARAALLETGDKDAAKAVLEWEARNPHEHETGSYLEIDGKTVGPYFTFREIALKNCVSRLRYEMQILHDRVMKLRHVVPPEPGSWWRFWSR